MSSQRGDGADTGRSATGSIDAVVAGVIAGSPREAARAMRWIDDGDPRASELVDRIWTHGGRARTIGITGVPGAGKSTLTACLVRALRERGARIGVIAVDPTSPFTGGAILGDRVRMQEHATDDAVFIRSVATRGHLGGLSESTLGIALVMEAMGIDVIVVETVGVGQDEVEIVRIADVTVVVVVPGLGDEVQHLKAGILEIADLLVVNKADRPGAGELARELRAMLTLSSTARRGRVPPEVVETSAATGRGIDGLVSALDELESDEARGRARALRSVGRVRAMVEAVVLGRLREDVGRAIGDPDVAAMVEALARREGAPSEAVRSVLAAVRRGPK